MPLPNELEAINPDDLPAKAGVLVACCPESSTTMRIIEVVDCQDLRAFVSANSLRWASLCSKYLRYLVFASEDSARRAAVLKAVEQARKTGKQSPRPWR